MHRADKNAAGRRFNGTFIVTASSWLALIVALAGWSYWEAYRAALSNVRATAHEAFEKDLTYRRWSAIHGGVYVPITPETPPNPFLADYPERDIRTPSGKRLTLVNPAYMTRQVHELGWKTSNVKGHITSLNPIRPENVPDEWEKRALQGFERDRKEVSSFESIGGETFYRLMNPLIVEEGCLKCHAAQGYKVGDIRGGISVSVPWKTFGESLQSQFRVIVLTYGTVWVIGILGIGLSRRRLQRYLSERGRSEQAVRESEQLWRLSIDHMLEGYALHEAIFDANGRMVDYRFLEFNPAAQKIANIAREKIVGGTAMALFPHVVERGLMDRYADVMASGVPAAIEDFYYAGDNLDKAFDISCFRIDDRHFVCLFRDVTDQKRAEIEKRQAQQESQRLTEELGIIAQIGRVIGSTLDIDEVYERFAVETRRLIPFDSLIVNLKKPLDAAMEIAWAWGVEIQNRKKGDSFPLKGSVSETVIATQKGMIIRPEEISKYIGTLSSLRVTTEAGLMSMMSVPLIDRGSVIGVLVFRSQRKNAYRDDDLRLAEKIGMQISGAIANSRLYNNLRKITIELQESEAKFRAIFENSIDAIGVSKKGVHLFANPSYLALYGYDSQEIAGKPVLDLIVPEERDRIRDFIADRSRGRTTPVTFETRGLRKDGGIFDMEVRVSLYSLGGDIFALSIIRDITALKEAEQELRSANLLFSLFMKHSPIYTFIKEVSPNRSVVLKASDNYRQMIGRPAHEMIGRSMEELFPSELAAAMTVDDWGVVSKGETLTVEETLNHRNYSTVKFPIMLDQRTLLAGFTTDITDQRKLEESLRRAEKMEALGHLAGGVAHDLNNVLGVTMAYAEMMKEKTEPGTPLRKYADGIFTSAEKAAAIIQDLLTMARRGVTVSEVVDLNQMVSNVLKSAEYALLRDSHPPVDFTANLSREPMPISGSQVHLEKTALNLISNAAESISGRGEVTIRTERQYLDKPIHGYDEVREGEYAVLTVKDTGGGIKPEDLNRIFEPFFTKKKMGRSGTGLGLAIVWGTVKDHEGYIDVASEPGGGTAFTLYFPVTKGTMAEAGVTKIPLERYLGHGESILVVDDVAGQREIAEEILTQLGYAVRTASSGEEAIEYVKRQGADIVILDMIMDPGIDGLDTYRAILKIHPRQKAIIVSGFSETDRVKEAIRLGAGAYVRKPYSKEKIGVAVQRELEGEWQGQGEGDPWRKDA